MTQIDFTKLAEFMASRGVDLSENPEYEAQFLAVNERMARMGVSAEMAIQMMTQFLSSTLSDDPSTPKDIVDQ